MEAQLVKCIQKPAEKKKKGDVRYGRQDDEREEARSGDKLGDEGEGDRGNERVGKEVLAQVSTLMYLMVETLV